MRQPLNGLVRASDLGLEQDSTQALSRQETIQCTIIDSGRPDAEDQIVTALKWLLDASGANELEVA